MGGSRGVFPPLCVPIESHVRGHANFTRVDASDLLAASDHLHAPSCMMDICRRGGGTLKYWLLTCETTQDATISAGGVVAVSCLCTCLRFDSEPRKVV